MDILDSQLEKPEKSSLEEATETSNYISPPKPKIPNQFDYTTKSQEKTNGQRPPFFTGFSVKDQQEFSSKIKLKGDPAVPTSPLKKPEALKSSPIEIMHEPADLKFKNVTESDTSKKDENDLSKFIEKVPGKKEAPAAESFGAALKDSAASASSTSLPHTYGNPASVPLQKKEAPKFSYTYDQSKVWSSWAPPPKNAPAKTQPQAQAPQTQNQPEQKEIPKEENKEQVGAIVGAAGVAPAATVTPTSPTQTPVPATFPENPTTQTSEKNSENPYSQDLKAIEKLYSSTSSSDRGANIPVDAHPDPSKIFKGGPVNSPKITEEARERIKKNNPLAPIRTFEADTADAIRNKNASVIDIALAEKKKRELYQTEDRAIVPFFKSFFVVTLSVILVGGGLAAVGFYGYKYWTESFKPNPVVITETPIISYDAQVDIELKDASKKDVAVIIKRGLTNIATKGKIVEINLVNPPKTGSAEKKSFSAEQLIRLLNTKNMPPALARSLDSKFMLGIYSAKDGSGNSSFIIFKTNSYENSFAGMLAWEKGMAADISDLFTKDTSTASSTANLDDIYTIATSGFQDEIISNKDARVIKNEFGKILFLYSFIDQKTLVVTTSPEALNEIVARNEVAKIVK